MKNLKLIPIYTSNVLHRVKIHHNMSKPLPKVVIVGGGTGTFTILSGLKKYPLDLTAIISMTDSGGSNRIIRDEFGLLPTSDIRQCITALADESQHDLLRKLFTYRYESGTGISGMTFGNLLMAALTNILGSQEKAIVETCKLLAVKGQIIPVTLDNVHLVARYDHGKQVLGEHFIDEPDLQTGQHQIVELETIPKAVANPKAIQAILEADLVVLGPGDLFTSIICNLVVGGIPEALAKSKAKKVYVVNLMTRFGQTSNFNSQDHLTTLEKYLAPAKIDVCLVNSTSKFPPSILKRYAQEQAYPVKNHLTSTKNLSVIHTDFVSNAIFVPSKSDKLKRSLIRHDSTKLAKAIMAVLQS
ncbi:MAG: gluconeogenesis factor YvcK family protein [Patescibacteria group bacterium]